MHNEESKNLSARKINSEKAQSYENFQQTFDRCEVLLIVTEFLYLSSDKINFEFQQISL